MLVAGDPFSLARGHSADSSTPLASACTSSEPPGDGRTRNRREGQKTKEQAGIHSWLFVIEMDALWAMGVL